MKTSRLVDWLCERWTHWRGPRGGRLSPVTHMFIEDVQSFIVPYRRSRTTPIRARCEGTADDVATALCSLRSLAGESANHNDPTATVCEAVRTVVLHMLWRGYAAFEIQESVSRDDDTGARGPANDRPFRPVRAMHFAWMFRSLVLTIGIVGARRSHLDRDQRRLHFRRPNAIWFVAIPRRLGGRWGHRLAMMQLGLFSGVFPSWTTTALAGRGDGLRFDVARYSQWRAAFQSVSVKRWGWNGRDTSLTHQTEFFAFYRTVTFHHSLATLREHVMDEINCLLKKRLGLDVSVTLEGLPSATEILDIRGRMERGELPFGDAFRLATSL